MCSSDRYEDYLDRHGHIRSERKKLDRQEFERLSGEYERLLRRIDPDDIHLDEWKRTEELRFLLIESAEEDDPLD